MSNPVPEFLPYARHFIDDDDIDAVVSTLRSDWLTTGPRVQQFERALAEEVNVPYAIACASGTAALHLALLGAGIGEGDRVVVPTVTFLASANAVRHVGGEVVFADVDPATGLMGAAELEDAIARSKAQDHDIAAVMPVHLGGQCAQPETIQDIAVQAGAIVVEDAAHAIGTQYISQDGTSAPIGSCRHSRMSAFSFHPAKTIAMGEGGAVTTRDADLADAVRRFCNHGLRRHPESFANMDLAFSSDGSVNPWYYELHEPGFNYRASDLHCALGSSQLGKLEEFAARRRALVSLYREALQPFAPLVVPISELPGVLPAWHVFTVLIDFAAAATDRQTVMQLLREQGIGSQVLYIPVHLQPYYRHRYGWRHLPGADSYYERCLCLPLHLAMTDSNVDWVVETLAKVLGMEFPGLHRTDSHSRKRLQQKPRIEDSFPLETGAPVSFFKSHCLEARDFILRLMTEADVDERYQGWLLDEDVTRYLEAANSDCSLEGLKSYVANAGQDPDRLLYLIETRNGEQATGTISLKIRPHRGTATFGFLIGEKDYWGTDAALQAHVALFDFAFDSLKLRKISGSVLIRNIASHFLLRRLGFTKEGILRSEVRCGSGPDDTSDAVLYSMLAEEWRSSRDRFSHLMAP